VTPRLFLRIASAEARRRMSYRTDFWIQALLVLAIEAALHWFLWTSVYREAGRTEIAGFSLRGMVLYVLAALLAARAVRGVADSFDAGMSQDIYEGGLNRYIVYPTSYFAFKYAQHLGATFPVLVQLALFGGTMPFLLGLDPTASVSLSTLAMGAVSLAVANLLYFVMAYPLQGIAFWADNVWSLMVAQRLATATLGGAMFPLSLFPEGVREVFQALPFRHLFWGPVTTLLGRVDVSTWLGDLAAGLAWALGFALLGREVFRRGYLRYTGIGI
jgi:ABC-2 type transport system permease protein